MRFIFASLSAVGLAAIPAFAASAFTALQLLPPEQARNVAIIAGRDGTPEPERWHFLVHDPKAENGLREIVVNAGRKTADRTVSQFAETLTAGDVIDAEAIKVDSVQVAQLAREFGQVNKLSVSAMHFELRKSGPDAVPLWTVTCLDVSGAELGKLIVSATRGTVILHPGFAQEPQVAPLVADTRATPDPVAGDDDRSTSRSTKRTTTTRKRATPQPATPKPNIFQRMFGGQKR